MSALLTSARRTPHSQSAFTMLEIAISLAIIAFALVAIIGVLPYGMGVQRDNRQETIINQDATVFLDAIRNGEAGLDDLTNYVTSIEVRRSRYNVTKQGRLLTTNTVFTNLVSIYSNTATQFQLTNGYLILGLLSSPRIYRTNEVGIYDSNYVVATIRSLSGPAVEKFPQTNPDVLDQALSYRLVPEIDPYWEYEQVWTNGSQNAQFMGFSRNLQNNLYNLRLAFRWPYSANNPNGNGHQVFRTMMSGTMLATPIPPDPTYPNRPTNLYFFQPKLFRKAS